MRISFDLDDTLICYADDIPREPTPRWHKRFFASQELRLGSCYLIRELQSQGWDVGVFTTSRRSPQSIRRWFKSYGIRVADIINQSIYEQALSRHQFEDAPSKHPRLFGIDLHVDDSYGVLQEGETYGFRVVVMEPKNHNWTAQVLETATNLL